RVRHDAGAAGTQLLFRSERVFEGHLVVEAREAAIHGHVLASAEREQHRLLQPLVHDPAARARLRDARLATIEEREAFLERALEVGRHIPRTEPGAALDSRIRDSPERACDGTRSA